jgi:glycosyltransferase involved in cell wall biosynthesis
MSGETKSGDDGAGRIALAVPTRDRAELFERCLLPDLRAAATAGYEVVVVDQSEGPETRALVEAVEGIQYLRSEPGLSRARNEAIRATRAPLIAFTDDDVTLPPGWLPRIVELFSSRDVGAVCGRAVTPDGTLQPGSGSGVYRWPAHPFRLGSGFNLSLRREALEEVGAFDERLGAGARFSSAEDTDMLYRLLKAGWSVLCSDDITVVHHDWRSRRAEVRLHYRYGCGAGAQTAKHVAAGDREAARVALREVALHLATVPKALRSGQVRTAWLQAPFLLGLACGFVAGRREQGRPDRKKPTR